MSKRNICAGGTILCGLLAIVSKLSNYTRIWHWPNNAPIWLALVLVSAIFATQWIEYQHRQDARSK